jgi:hypothetical protein
MTVAAAFAAWLGAAMIVLSEGRRALAVALGLVGAALAGLAWATVGWPAAVALLAGGLAAAALRLRTGAPGWQVMPPRSTPRFILAVVAGILALWVAVSVMTGPGAPLRFAALAVIGLMTARVLTSDAPEVILTAIAALALAVAAASGLAPAAGLATFVAAALIAAGISFLRMSEAHGA